MVIGSTTTVGKVNFRGGVLFEGCKNGEGRGVILGVFSTGNSVIDSVGVGIC